MNPNKLILRCVSPKDYATGECNWRFKSPIRYDSWNHAPSHWMQGPCPNCGSPTSTYGGGWTCHSTHCPSSADNFACSAGPTPEWWGTQINVFKDGNAWCATEDNFINLQESAAGFGDSPRAAFENLKESLVSATP